MIAPSRHSGVRHGPIGARSVHLCIDMQNLLGPASPWHATWAERVLPAIVRVVERDPSRTVFTRFIPPRNVNDMPAPWQRFYRRWHCLTRGTIDPRLLDLMAPLARYVPPAEVIDKPVYSPFSGQRLLRLLHERRVDTLIVSGAETDVCVLATVLHAIDAGFRVIVAGDALCSSSDRTHDALITFYRERLQHQVELAPVAEVLDAWTGQ